MSEVWLVPSFPLYQKSYTSGHSDRDDSASLGGNLDLLGARSHGGVTVFKGVGAEFGTGHGVEVGVVIDLWGKGLRLYFGIGDFLCGRGFGVGAIAQLSSYNWTKLVLRLFL
jgi:hypothetical protein